MPQFEIIDHTADIGIAAYGNDIKEVFATSAYAMFKLIADLDNVGEKLKRDIEVTATDKEILLVSWLNELLYVCEVEHMLFKRFDIVHLDQNRLKAKVFGEKIDSAHHEIKIDIKAATYHMLKIEKIANGNFKAQVIFDI